MVYSSGLTSLIPTFESDFFIAVTSHDKTVTESPNILDLRPLRRRRMEE